MKKLTVLCDMDSIVTDFLQAWVDAINAKFNRKVQYDDVIHWDMAKVDKIKDINSGKIYGIMRKPMFFYDLKPLDGAIDTMQKIVRDGHDVRFLTTPANPHSAMEKLMWVDKYFPFIGSRNVILANDKPMVKGDVFIDDKPDHLEKYSVEWPNALVMTIEYPYNAHLKSNKNIVFTDRHNRTVAAWNLIYNNILIKSNQ